MNERHWAPGWKTVEYVNEGDEVWAPQTSRSSNAVRCVVRVAAGKQCRIVNVERGVDRWVHIRELRVKDLAPEA